MAFDDVVSPVPVPTTRRAVLRTGVKLAYAAPVVAASMKLAEQAAEAQVSAVAGCSGGGCFKDAVCGAFADCGGGCNCWFTPSGGTRCFTSNSACDQGPTCNSDLDCPSGWGCASNCCGNQCFPCCGTEAVVTASSAEAGSANTD